MVAIVPLIANAGHERVLVFRPDDPQGAKIGVAIKEEQQLIYSELANEAKAESLTLQGFLEILKQKGITVFDASSL